MSLKELKRPAQSKVTPSNQTVIEKKAEEFISKGGKLAGAPATSDDDHRLTLRIPRWLLAKVDVKRKERVGTISRNLWILELIEKSTKK